ncbi:zinc finger, CCHC-type containing protein, partial [Tanacetum coccineum]
GCGGGGVVRVATAGDGCRDGGVGGLWTCTIKGTGKVKIQLHDGSSFILEDVRYVPGLRRSLISFGTLKKEGYTVKMQMGRIKVIKGCRVMMTGIRKKNCVYTLEAKVMTFGVQKHGGSKQGAQGDRKAEVFQVSNDDAAVAQRWLEDRQPEEKTNTDCLVKEQEKVHLGIKVGANITVTGVPGQEGAEGNVAEKKKVKESMKANLEKLLKYNAWSTRWSPDIRSKLNIGFFSHLKCKGTLSKIASSLNSLNYNGVIPHHTLTRNVNDGKSTAFWHDLWLGNFSLKDKFPRLYQADPQKNCLGVHFLDRPDAWHWNLANSKNFTVKETRLHIDDALLPNHLPETQWCRFIPKNVNILSWRVLRDRLLNRWNLIRKGFIIPSLLCTVCSSFPETNFHIFWSCNVASAIRKFIFNWVDIHPPSILDLSDLFNWLDDSSSIKSSYKSISDLFNSDLVDKVVHYLFL